MSKPCNNCNKDNNDNCCSDSDLKQDITAGYAKLCEYADKLIREKRFGHKCEEDICGKVEKLTGLIEVLESENKKRLQGHQPCLNCNSLQTLREQIISIVGVNCGLGYTDCEIDESGKEEWTLNNPRCASFEDWEKASYWFCDKLDLRLKIPAEEVCNLTLALKKEIISADILLVAKVIDQVNKLELKVSRSIDECKIDFKLLHSKVECNLDLKTYIKLIENNISFDLIRTVYENNLELKLSTEDVPQIKTPLGDFAICDISPDMDSAKEFGINPTKTIEDLMGDYN